MKRKCLIYLFLLLCVCSACSSELQRAVQRGVLPCGLTYYVLPNNRPGGLVNVYLVQGSGSAMEDDDTRGYSHFVEHMAFRGTKNYPGKSIDKYLSSKGLKFGAQYNATTTSSYTRFEITDIQVDDEAAVSKCIDILHDISCNITFDSQSVDSERNVILEEGRSSGAMERKIDSELRKQLITKGNRYHSLSTIGTLSALNRANSQSLREFYQKWYKPERQAIIVVGDINAQKAVKILSKIWHGESKVLPVSVLSQDTIPAYPSPKAAVYCAKDVYNNQLTLMYPQTVSDDASLVDYYTLLYLSDILQDRLHELSLGDGSSVYDPEVDVDNFMECPIQQAFSVNVQYINGAMGEAIRLIANEIKRLRLYGVTEREAEMAQATCKTSADNYKAIRNQLTSRELASSLTHHFVTGEVLPSVREGGYDDLLPQLLENLTVDGLNGYINKVFSDTNYAIELISRELDDTQKLTAEQLVDLYVKAYEKATPSEPDSEAVGFDLDAYSPTAGTIVSESKNPDFTQYDARDFLLSNGVRVRAVQVNVMEDEILFTAVAPGGVSLSAKENPQGAFFASDVWQLAGLGELTRVQLDRLMKDKTLSISTNYDEGSISVFAGGIKKNLEKMLKLVNQAFKPVRRSNSSFETWKRQYISQLDGLLSVPEYVLGDTIAKILHGNDYCSFAMPHVSDLEQLNYDKTCDDIDGQLADIENFTFIITGTFDYDTLIPLIEKYLASIESMTTAKRVDSEQALDEKWIAMRKSLRMAIPMEQKRTIVSRLYQAPLYQDIVFDVGLKMLSMVLQDRYLTTIRGVEGGTYSVDVSAQFPSADELATLVISFESNAEKAEQMTQKVHRELVDIAENGVTDDEYASVMSYYMDYYSRVEKQPQFPLMVLTRKAVRGNDDVLLLFDAVLQVNRGLLQQLAKVLVNAPSQLDVILTAEE